MTVNGITPELAAAIPPLNVREYALATGWVRQPSRRPERVILSRRNSPDQLIFPNDPTFDDYGQTLLDLIEKLSDFEKRPAFEIYTDLIAPEADQVRAGVLSSDADRGQLDFDHAVSFFGGLRQAIVSAACSVIAPQKFHPKLNRADALELVRSAKLNHSERSSYAVSVSLPLRSGDEGMLGEPFTRKVTKLLLRSLVRIYEGIELDHVGRIADENNPGEPVISANLCDALLKFQPADEKAIVKVGVNWAPVRPEPELDSLPRFIRLRREHFEKIGDLRSRLLPPPPTLPGSYFGYVEELYGEPGEDGRRNGDVELMLMQDGGAIEFAIVNLTSDQYRDAVSAHMKSAVVRVRGLFERRVRVHRIKDATFFGIVPDEVAVAK